MIDTHSIQAIEIEMARLRNRIAEYERAKEINVGVYSYPKETGAIRRASLDLTRALAQMRKP
jgi:hypothetical protein